MTLKTDLLAGVSMTAAERAQGRYMRAPDGHPSDFDNAFAAAAASATGDLPSGDDTTTGGEGADTLTAGGGDDTTTGGEGADTLTAGAGDDTATGGEGADTVAAGAGDDTTTGGEGADTVKGGQGADATKPSADDILNRIATALESKPAAPAPEAQPNGGQAEEQTPLYSPDEIGVLSEYEKNWPDVSRAETLKRRAEYHDIFKFVFTEVMNVINPMQEQLRAVGNSLHMGELKAAVPDYSENLEQEVTSWIGTQPAYLQAAYNQVMKTGTSEEVADLIGRYREASGAKPAAPSGAASVAQPSGQAAPKPPAKTELSSAAKQAAESLAPVSSDRTSVPQGEDQQDFDSAFKRWAAESA